jgi:hypothetical protein
MSKPPPAAIADRMIMAMVNQQIQSIQLILKNLVNQEVQEGLKDQWLFAGIVNGRNVTDVSPLSLMELDRRALADDLFRAYLKQILVDGFLHADPHAGNLLVADDGTIVVLDWGMVLDVPKWIRDAILSVALAVAREDLDGMINGMYRLGMISPEVSRGEIREAATEILRIMEKARTSTRDRIQEIVQEVWDTFYTWPLLLPQELVYFFRAAVLLEGVGFRYDPDFNGLLLVRRVIRQYRTEIVRETAREPVAAARDFLDEAGAVVRSVRDLLTRAERDEVRVRIHPRDVQGMERFLHLQARRLLLSIFATATAIISAIIFVALENPWLLGLGLLAALRLQPRQQPLGTLGHVLRGDRLGGLGPHLVSLRVEGCGLLLGVGALALTALLVRLALDRVLLPAHVVEVDPGPVGIEITDLVDHGLDQLDVMGNDDEPATVGLEEVPEPADRVGVEVVRRFVQQQGVGVGEENPGQLDAAALATGEGVQRLFEHPVRQAETRGDGGGLGLGGVAALGQELGLQTLVLLQRPVADGALAVRHTVLVLPHLAQYGVQAAGGQNAVTSQGVQVTGTRVLRQVADLTGAGDAAGGRGAFPGQALGQGGLAGTVAADQTDAVAAGDAEGCGLDEDTGAGAQLKAGGGDHGQTPDGCGRGAGRCDGAVTRWAVPWPWP